MIKADPMVFSNSVEDIRNINRELISSELGKIMEVKRPQPLHLWIPTVLLLLLAYFISLLFLFPVSQRSFS